MDRQTPFWRVPFQEQLCLSRRQRRQDDRLLVGVRGIGLWLARRIGHGLKNFVRAAKIKAHRPARCREGLSAALGRRQ